MHAESIPVGVVTFAAVDALGDVLGGVLADRQPERQQVRDEIRRQVRDAVQGVDAGRAAADRARMDADLQRARDAVVNLQGPGGNLSITRDGANIVIHTPDGKTITVDQSVVPPQAIEGLVSSIGAPRPLPPVPDGGPPENVIRLVSIALVCLTIMVIFATAARTIGRRADRRAAMGGGLPPDVSLRLERIEQAVDAMAVEMERVSEAQRYSARLLTERLPEPLPQLAAADAARPTPDRG